MLRRLLMMVVLATATVLGSPSQSTARDKDTAAFRDLAIGTDYRVRVAAALALGRSKSPGALPALQKALKDQHPAVRAAAVAGLSALGDAAAVPALKAARDAEPSIGVKRQMESAIARLSKPSAKARFLVSLGKFENRSGVKDAALGPLLRDRTRDQVARIPGIEVVADGLDVAVEGKNRKLPAFKLDGSVTQLSSRRGKDGISYSARVEYVIREMPSQTLKGSISGSAQALGDARRPQGRLDIARLRSDAVAGAVESALRGAPLALEAASGSSGASAGR